MGRAARTWHHGRCSTATDALEQDSTIIAVIEMSQAKWLVAALVPGIERQPLKKFDANEETLLKLLRRWRREASQAGRDIKRIVVAYEAGRDGFWLARWLRARDVEVYVIHPTALRCRASTGAQRPIVSIRNF
jgi:transposase